MTVWLGLPGGEGGLLGLLPWLPCEVSPGCTSPPGVLVSVCRGGACPSLPLGRRLPWSPGCGGLLPCGSFFCFVSRKSGAAHLVLDSVFIFCTFESFLISAGQSRLFPVSELHDFGVFRFSLTFGRFQRWMLREIGDRYLHDDFQLTRTWHQRFEIVTCMTTFRLHRREVKRFTWIQLLNSFQWGSIQWSFVRQIWLSSHS